MLYPADRPALKMRAKEAMKKASPNLYLVSVVCLLLTNAPTFVTEFPALRQMVNANSVEEMVHIYETSGAAAGGFALSLATMAMSFFLNLVSCGWQLYTLRVSRQEDHGGLETLFACFQQFWRFLSAVLLMGLFTIYIMLDHPELSAMEAIAASKQLMRGHKFEYFVLELSFLGWALLTGVTLGLLTIWLEPYMQVTKANYYNALTGWQKIEPQEEPAAAEPEEWWKQ